MRLRQGVDMACGAHGHVGGGRNRTADGGRIRDLFGKARQESGCLHGAVDNRVVAGADMAGIAAIELAGIHDIREIIH